MRRFFLSCGLAATIGAVSACDGSNGDDALFVGGMWAGSFTLVENPCSLPGLAQTFAFQHDVNQNEEAVVLRTEANAEYIGSTLDDGFSVDSAGPEGQDIGGGVSCGFANRIEYDDIFDDDDNDALAEMRTTRSCSDGNSCEIVYRGTAVRGRGVPPSPTASPAGTPAARGSCSAMDERGFSGDGGCGVGSVDLSRGTSAGSSAIVLNPFGVNGPTSFVISSDESVANSTRSDLQIRNEVGYSCTVTCSPPISFSVSCFQEGGDTCEERF